MRRPSSFTSCFTFRCSRRVAHVARIIAEKLSELSPRKFFSVRKPRRHPVEHPKGRGAALGLPPPRRDFAGKTPPIIQHNCNYVELSCIDFKGNYWRQYGAEDSGCARQGFAVFSTGSGWIEQNAAKLNGDYAYNLLNFLHRTLCTLFDPDHKTPYVRPSFYLSRTTFIDRALKVCEVCGNYISYGVCIRLKEA